jgi:hypothetical protein
MSDDNFSPSWQTGIIMKMKALQSFEMSVTTITTTWRNILGDLDLQGLRL